MCRKGPEKLPVAISKIMAAVAIALMLALHAASARSPEAADDTARFLAGLPPSPNSPLAALTKDPAWLSHARYFEFHFCARGERQTFQGPPIFEEVFDG